MGSHGPLKLVFGGASMQVIPQRARIHTPGLQLLAWVPCGLDVAIDSWIQECTIVPTWCTQAGASWLPDSTMGGHPIWLRTDSQSWHQLQPQP